MSTLSMKKRGSAGGTSSLRRDAVRVMMDPPRELPNVGETDARDVAGIVGSTVTLNTCVAPLNCSVQIESKEIEDAGENPEMLNKRRDGSERLTAVITVN